MLSHAYAYQQQTFHYVQPPPPPTTTSLSAAGAVPGCGGRADDRADGRADGRTDDQADSAGPAFGRFGALPPEIRAMIWAYALPAPRVYEIMDVPHATQKMEAAEGLMFANVHHEPPPALAAVCREARALVLRRYRPLTLGRTTKHVDLARDLLLLEPYLLLKRLHRTLRFLSRIPLVRDRLAALALGTTFGVCAGIGHPVLGWRRGGKGRGGHGGHSSGAGSGAGSGNVASRNRHIGSLLAALARFPKLRTLLFVVHQEFQFAFDVRDPLPGLLPAAPQVVHQAYRFMFDIEGSVNRRPRRPHVNELLFYPLGGGGSGGGHSRQSSQSSSEDDEDDWEALLSRSSHSHSSHSSHSSPSSQNSPAAHSGPCCGDGGGRGGGKGGADENGGGWCDPWPTNDDWRRFRRRFQRAVVATVQAQQAEQAQQACAGLPHGGPRRLSAGLHGSSGRVRSQRSSAARRDGRRGRTSRGSPKDGRRHDHGSHQLPAIEGASLLWRYMRG